jgi:hypothetical protein
MVGSHYTVVGRQHAVVGSHYTVVGRQHAVVGSHDIVVGRRSSVTGRTTAASQGSWHPRIALGTPPPLR